MEHIVSTGNFRKLLQLIGVTSKRTLGVGVVDGLLVDNQQQQIVRWSEQFKTVYLTSSVSPSHSYFDPRPMVRFDGSIIRSGDS